MAKSKDGSDGDAHAFRLEVVELGHDEHSAPITSCVVRRDESAQEIRRVKLPQGGNQKLALEALRPMFKEGRLARPGAPPMRPCIELESAVLRAAAVMTCTSDRKTERAREAIKGLVNRGLMGLNEGWLWLV